MSSLEGGKKKQQKVVETANQKDSQKVSLVAVKWSREGGKKKQQKVVETANQKDSQEVSLVAVKWSREGGKKKQQKVVETANQKDSQEVSLVAVMSSREGGKKKPLKEPKKVKKFWDAQAICSCYKQKQKQQNSVDAAKQKDSQKGRLVGDGIKKPGKK